jgi:hypothetical protein
MDRYLTIQEAIDRGLRSQREARSIQIANAYEAVARANHYMVGIVGKKPGIVELEDAKQVLINRQNILRPGSAFKRLDLALDLIEQAIVQ